MSALDLLNNRIEETNSFLCVGLDPQLSTLKQLNMESKLTELNVAIVDAVADYACAFKPQFAHYAALGLESALAETCEYIKSHYPHIPVILDAKRGDIGSTAEKYAVEAYERYHADAVTVNPYMGTDVIDPFLKYQDKAVIILIKTSNPSGKEIQDLTLESGKKLYQYLAESLYQKYQADKLWFVVGATQPEQLSLLRGLCPETTFLVPGVGAQGGDVTSVVKNGMMKSGLGLVVNVSRGITNTDSDTNSIESYIDSVLKKTEKFYADLRDARNIFCAK